MITFKPLWTLIYFSLKHIPSTHFHPTLPCLTLPSWKPLQQPSRKALILNVLLQFSGLHYPTNKLPWTPPYLILQDNIAMHVNWPSTLYTPAGNKAYISWHPSSIIKYNNTISRMYLHQNYPLLAHQLVPLPTYPPSNNRNTCTQPENLRLFQHSNHSLTH